METCSVLFCARAATAQSWSARQIAAALTGKPIALENPVTAEVPAVLDSGIAVEIRCSRFKDPDLEMVARAIGWAQVVQSAGRPRAVNRTEETPLLDMYIASNLELPWPCVEVRRWDDIDPNSVQRMFARGVIFESPRDACRFYPDLFPNEDAARMAFKREHGANTAGLGGPEVPDIPLYKTLI